MTFPAKLRSGLLAIAMASTPAWIAAAPAATDDPYLWLEDIEGARPIAQVQQWNGETDRLLRAAPSFEKDRARARAILDDESQIALPDRVMGDQVTNLWRDAKNPRGLWRSSDLASYIAGKPVWKTIIDVDALGKAEGKSWVWHGADCLAPDYRRCLVSLSPGGTDADVVREFDLTTGQFVEGGFTLPEAKSDVAWLDRDTLLVATDYGAGSLTDSGYPRVVKKWRRGTPLAAATLVREGIASDISVRPRVELDGDRRWAFIDRSLSFYSNELYLEDDNGRLIRTPVPETADMRGLIEGQMIVLLNDPLGEIPAGSLVSWPIADVAAGKAGAPQLILKPTKTTVVEEVRASDHVLWVKQLDNVSGALLAMTRDPASGRWTSRAVPLADKATVHLAGTADRQDLVFASVEGMLTPPSLMVAGAATPARTIQQLPARFDASRFSVEQRFATSKDGTRVPYFLARRKGVTGPVPAFIHAYGGFRAAQTPTYLTTEPYRAGPLGLFWVEDGNAYVLANIRGGGEYGPTWHQAALREKRQNAFDDLAAVAEDLVKTGVSTKGRIGISGRSNGGVLVGAAMTQRPDLYGAVIAGSPLEDMQRYSHMSAGASWVAEYGDPDKPEDWAFLGKWSPYQNVEPGVHYPPAFFYLSTKDDRVHPGHARKMAAKLKATGSTVYYHEYLEGGHSVGADHAEDAVRAALLHAFLTKELVEKK
ncbi:prolyl oligopeptidase family serine peptidase [Sphingobium sp.]|uniref:prolyl oligopeptidase family serine peptidase n=1 Tax=Sphingobium sp. TaxID=1912891 RepID=UPI002B9B5161|nr:prolyl oligopeptidase family serine peptidase [Sphingobium sp.]HUD91586.1 prolyl oligopeptidase family serine peptidase [Sphingobium sp.]